MANDIWKMSLPSVDPALIPQTQIQQRPEMKAPVLRPVAVLLQHAADKFIIQKLATPHRRIHHMFFKPPAEAFAKPLANRRAKTALAFVKQIARQDLFQRALQNMLAARAFDFQ